MSPMSKRIVEISADTVASIDHWVLPKVSGLHQLFPKHKFTFTLGYINIPLISYHVVGELFITLWFLIHSNEDYG